MQPAFGMRVWPPIWALVRLGRPVFLLGGVVLHGLGVALAHHRGLALAVDVAVLSQLAVSAIQLMTHYSNDYFDYRTDVANATPTRWSGGSRVLPNGELPKGAALVAAIVCAVIAIALTIGLARITTHAVVVPLLAAMLVLAWSYSSPPLRLHGRGLGEPTVMLVVTIGTPLVGLAAQGGAIDLAALFVCLPLALLQLVMLLVIELPDEAGDRATGKRTFVVIFGAPRAVACAKAAIVASYAALACFVPMGLPATLPLAMAMTCPLAIVLMHRLGGQRWRTPAAWGGLAFAAVALFFASCCAALAGLVLA